MENIFLLEEVLKFQKLSGLISEKVYKSNLKKINNFEGTVLGSLTKELQKEYVKNIHKSSLFNESESKYLKDYFKKYTSINESNIRKHNLLLKEGFIGNVGKFFGDAWNKIKQVYGNIKNFVSKAFEFLKTNTIKICTKIYEYIKNQLNSKKQAFLTYLNKADHHVLKTEFDKCNELYGFFKKYINNFWISLTQQVLNNPDITALYASTLLGETFTSKRMIQLFENSSTGEVPHELEDMFVKNAAGNKILKLLMKAIKLILNPVTLIISEIVKFSLSKIFQASNYLASKVGGPEVIKWVVLPGAIIATYELLDKQFDITHHLIEHWSKEVLSLFTQEAELLLEIGGYVYLAYACYEFAATISNTWQSLTQKQPVQQSTQQSTQQPVKQSVQ